MKLSDLHSLIENNIAFKGLNEKQILACYDSAYKSVYSKRDEVIEPLFDNQFVTIENKWIVDEKLGFDIVDEKIRELFPTLQTSQRLLLYTLAQYRVSLFYESGYELSTQRGNAYKEINLKSILTPFVKVLNTQSLEKIFPSLLTAKTFLLDYTDKAFVYTSKLAYRVYTMLTTSTKVYLKSTLKLNVSLATIIPKALTYTSKLAYRIRLEAQKSFAYQSKLSLNCRVITDFDENAGFTYASKLSLNLSLE